MKNFFIIISVIFLHSCKSENKYDSDGFKHGKWIEYLVSADASNENNCYFKNYNLKELDNYDSIKNHNYLVRREVIYDHGYPKGIIKDFETDIEKKPFSINEFYLVSGPYSKFLPRPQDKYTGLFKWIIYDQLIEWNYFDKNGNEDIFKKISTGVNDPEIQNDLRLLKPEYYKDSLNSESFGLFEKYQNKNELLLKNIENSKEIIKNKNIWTKAKNSCPYFEERAIYEILCFDTKNQNFISNSVKKKNYNSGERVIPICKWCGNPNNRYTAIGSSEWEYCSDRCWNQFRNSKGIY